MKDSLVRLRLDAADMAKARSLLSTLTPHSQLLWTLLACSGMRVGEPFNTNSGPQAVRSTFRSKN